MKNVRLVVSKFYGICSLGKVVLSHYITTRKGTSPEKGNTVNDLICYCFGYSVDDIKNDYMEKGKSTIMEKIQMEKKLGNCQCGTKNPKKK